MTYVCNWVKFLFVLIMFLACVGSYAQEPGQCVTVRSSNVDGVPVHASASNSFTGNRIANGSVVEVLEVTADDHWFRVQAENLVGWVVDDYLLDIVACDIVPVGTVEGVCRVATWNLERLRLGTTRGFPEFMGDEAIAARTDADYDFIAQTIQDLGITILILQEIHGQTTTENDEEVIRSPELDKLTQILGPAYRYEIAASGSSQRIALLWDSAAAFLNWTCEPELENSRVNGKNVFDRQPLLGYFTFFADGAELNDLVVVGVHLASGQPLTRNHDLAMQLIQDWVLQTRNDDFCIPRGEHDLIIAGDFNANRFDAYNEDFWEEMEIGPWDVLADSDAYPASRLSGNPPTQSTSKIDYIIISDDSGGLVGDEVMMTAAHVHGELVAPAGGGKAFRERASDHLPVTVDVQLVTDRD